MAALATLDDLRARLSADLPIADEARAEAILEDVSAAVRSATGQTVTGASPTARLRVRLGVVRLPQRAASAVSAVVDIDGDAVTYTWDGLQRLTGIRAPVAVVDVTYTHSQSAETLAAVAGIVATVAARAYGRGPEAGAMTGETMGGYSYSVDTSAASGGFGLLAAERRTLRRVLGVSNAGSFGIGFA